MLLWRISNHCNLDGLGGERSDGRWHSAVHGKRIAYLSEHPALALIEALANLKGNPQLFPDEFQLMKLTAGENIEVEKLQPDLLASDWKTSFDHTRTIGDAWLESRRTALLAVPSTPCPESTNYLMNPLHPSARRIQIEWCRWVRYDKRLFHLSGA